MRLSILLLFLSILSISFTSSAQQLTIRFSEDLAAGQQRPAGFDFENYLIQNLINYKIDTLKAVNGTITLPNNTKEITPYALARFQPRQIILFFAEPNQNFVLAVSEPSFTVKSATGSQSQAAYMDFITKQESKQKEVQRLQAEMAGTKYPDSLSRQITYNQMLLNAQFIDFVNAQKDNNLGAYMVYDVASNNQQISGADLDGLYNKLSEKGKKTTVGKKIKQHVQRLKAMDIGNKSPDFTLKDQHGKKYNLSSFKGKYVLLDFWASWCGPCVKEIPHLKEAYEKYHNKGFEIISVSIDRDRAKWLQALEKYQMPWVGLIDNEKQEDKITQTLYHVPTIPRTVLLDKDGVVIGGNYRGEALEAKLAELLD